VLHGHLLAVHPLVSDVGHGQGASAELAGGFGLPEAGPLPGRIEDSFRRQLAGLPEQTRRLLAVAAADPSGDPLLVWRAAGRLGIPAQAGAPAVGAAAVLDRATALIAQLERQHCGRDFLLVSHGDILQILQAGFSGMDPSKHRLLPHLATAEIARCASGKELQVAA